MAVNPDFAGRSYPPSEPYAVTAAQIAAFAAAIGATDPVHSDAQAARAAGHRDVIAPPSMAVMWGQRGDRQYIQDPEAGIDYSRLVHGEQSFVHHRPITAGDHIVATVTIESIKSAGGHSMVSTRAELATAAGEALTTCRATYVIRGGE